MRKIENMESNRGYYRTECLKVNMKKSPRQEEVCVEKLAQASSPGAMQFWFLVSSKFSGDLAWYALSL